MADRIAPKRWSLDDLLPEPIDESITAALAELGEAVASFETQRERLTDDLSPDEFLAILRQYEAISHRAHRLGAYAYLRFAEDTQNQTALSIRDRLDQALTTLNNRTLFFILWLKALSDEAAARLAPPDEDLRYFIDSARKFQPHTLSAVSYTHLDVYKRQAMRAGGI